MRTLVLLSFAAVLALAPRAWGQEEEPPAEPRPERLYVIDEQGKIAYKGKVGPFGYEPDEVEAWLTEHCGR